MQEKLSDISYPAHCATKFQQEI